VSRTEVMLPDLMVQENSGRKENDNGDGELLASQQCKNARCI
jgi:hypothetical protein